jgi:methylated-DNA-[protein]-cysteine S-methyltransferase
MKVCVLKKRIRKRIQRDPDLTAFRKKVLSAALEIPEGEVRTYGEIACAIGNPRSARAVGQALAKNPYAPEVPCHRVVASGGRIGGYSGPGGIREKKRLLSRERSAHGRRRSR